ncbi:MAG: STAS domain-containing protein [Pseudomonadales bacterium]|nr:STAS domain-containing protein [Pseudomonadales bacterium]
MHHQSTYSPNGDLVLSLSGEMDAHGCSQIKSILEEIVSSVQTPNVLLDLNDVEFIDSSGIGAIVYLFKRLKAQHQTLVIRGVHGQPKELMELLRVGSAIPISFCTGQVQSPGDNQCIV